jgi:CheY-like chemotaxis protein
MGNILVVEDDHAVSEVICDVLRGRGFSVESVRSDHQAYARITSFPAPDGLVVDINLGGGASGYDIARFARQAMPDVAVVYVSGKARLDSFKAFGVPDSEFVEKPFLPDELLAAVTSLVAPAPQTLDIPLI